MLPFDLHNLEGSSLIVLSISIMLLFGFLATRITKLVKLPNVTAYILTGIIIGPYCLNLIPASVVEGMDFLADISLAFIAFGMGEFFRFSVLKKSGVGVVITALLEALLSFVLVFAVTYYVLRLDFAFSIVASALASATAPASTMMTIRQIHAKGDFVNTLLQVVAIDNIVALLAYSVTISVAVATLNSTKLSIMSIVEPIVINFAVMLLGGVFALFMKLFIQKKRSTDNRLIIAIALLFAFCGICVVLDVSPMLGCMSMGMVYINISDDDKLFKQLNYFTPPLLLLFFVRSGLSFRIDALISPQGGVGNMPLLVVAVIYFAVRITGKYSGSFFGCIIAGKDKSARNNLGLALIPQAGVAIPLVVMGARAIGGELGQALETVILAAGIFYEIVGPACAKFALFNSGACSNKLEALVDVAEIDLNGKKKNDVDVLIERIKCIREKLPEYEDSEEEQAFTSAAEEQYESIYETMTSVRRRRFNNKKL